MRTTSSVATVRHGATILAALVAVLLLFTAKASADFSGQFCPPTGGGTITIVNGTAGTCVHGNHHALSQVQVYRLNNTVVVHCAGGNSSTAPGSSHTISYACGIGTAPNGFLATAYNNNPPQCAYPAHKNSGTQTWSGFYGYFNFTAECV